MSQRTRQQRSEKRKLEQDRLEWEGQPQKEKAILTTFLGIAALVVYILTLYPSVGPGDSAELTTAAYSLGVAHPPGYPLFTLLAKVFTWIPIGVVAWRVNLLSAVCDSVAAVLLMLAVARWSRNVWAGFVSGGLLAFSPLIWRYAVVDEVFALNNLLIATLLYLGVRYFDKKEQTVANCAAFFCGLALSNHHTSVFYGFPLFVFLVISRYQEERSWKPLLRLS